MDLKEMLQQLVSNGGALGWGLYYLGKLLGAGLAMGIGAIGPGVGEGQVGAHAMDSIARQPEMSGTITTRMLLAMAVTESTGLYSLVISLVMIFVLP
ncbi:F0F1 ATP synthase subunit C [Oceanotoga sp. DSM 15011]|jgi:F-type H+-transporting ATPase subunit c|uniref:ATP synthase subunit c n=1 Tax=Oceanotoga teriensis TaxID=515440 RepID=A0AA45C7C3_9BACT|nr:MULTISPECIES: F0F1 ATP synthase subunit C [Oceanotoga]MDN5343077.1 F-type H+-transporting ATPase subunit c [Oceanotoga sp.]MDO7976713.1 F0F1 ATP synthase subunit C [Oceanotoga teriensis]PWJ95234.1 ATP synthase F0 subcomplex C subunit [Oceanotoga teriensis]UYP00640.1 F0F1 ATP synthase subunit C [Oceanotoga sp. DSM 15011]